MISRKFERLVSSIGVACPVVLALTVNLAVDATLAAAQGPPQGTVSAAPQGGPQTPPQAAGTQAAGQPPSFLFPAEGITLDDAVRLTIEHDPAILRARAVVQQRQGIAQEQSGIFDLTLGATGTYTNRIQELSDSRKKSELDKRTSKQSAIDQNEQGIALGQQLITALNNVRNGPVGGPQVSSLAQLSPTIGGTVQLFDQLIGSTTDAGLRSSLQSQRSQFLTSTINASQTSIDQSIQENNELRTELQNLGVAPTDDVVIDGFVGFAASKLTRSGISFAPYFDGAFSGSNFRHKPNAAEFGGKGLSDLYTLHGGVTFGVPVMRGRGPKAVAAPERAARLARDAADLDLQHQTAASVLTTVLAYWDLKAAQEAVSIATQSAEYQDRLMTLVQGLIAAGEQPQAEISRAQAAVARSQAELESTRRQLQDARVALASALGVSATLDDATLPRARDEFPRPPDPAAPVAPPQTTDVLAQATSQRLDLSAAIKSVEAEDVLVEGARRNLPAKLDLAVGTFYTALDQGNFGNAADRWVGPSATASLTFEKPLGNNALHGQYVQREAEAEQSRIARNELARQIRLGVLESTGTVQEAVARLLQAQAAVGYYQTMVDAQTQRLRIGETTLVDTVVTQQQQTLAMAALTLARQDLAHRIAQARFETGTLVTNGVVRIQDLITVPPPLRRVP